MAIDELMDLRREPAAGTAQRMISWLDAEILVVPQSPCGALEGGAVLVSAADRGVDRDRPVQLTVRVGTDQQRVEDLVPGAVNCPGAVALPDCLPGPEVGGEIAPGNPTPVAVDDSLDNLSMIPPRPS